MAISLHTSRQLQGLEGEPAAVVRVRNLQCTIKGPQDAWGRPGKPQPMLVSAEVSLEQPFGSSSAADAVASDTVHYGLLSKAVLATVARLESEAASEDGQTLYGVLNNIWADLTGLDVQGTQVTSGEKQAFLNVSLVRRLTITVNLPKASLLGSAVRLSASALFQGASLAARGMALSLVGLKVPTLIGVNDNERTAKQVVVANVCIEKYRDGNDNYAPLEQVIIECMTKSSYETLEALATDISGQVTKQLEVQSQSSGKVGGWQIGIGLEKPTAVPFAEAACVELRTNTQDA